MLDVSVSMITHNRLYMTKQSIESFLNNSPTNSQIVVVDNASTDGTREWLQETYSDNPRVILELSNKNLWPGGGHKLGLSLCKESEFYYIADNDCLFVDTNWFDYSKKVMDAHPEIGLMGTRESVFQPENQDPSILARRQYVEEVAHIHWPRLAAYSIFRKDARDAFVQYLNGQWIGGYIVPIVEQVLGKRCNKLIPGQVHDLSDLDLDNEEQEQYYIDIWTAKGRVSEFYKRREAVREYKTKNNL